MIKVLAVLTAVLGFSTALPSAASAQYCVPQCYQVADQLGRIIMRCAQYGCGIPTIQKLNQQPPRYPPGVWRPYQPPPGYYRPRPVYPGTWYPSRRY
jgi:hypothetical protein